MIVHSYVLSIPTVYPALIVIGPQLNAFANSGSVCVVPPICIFSATTAALVLINDFSPSDAPPPPTLVQPATP